MRITEPPCSEWNSLVERNKIVAQSLRAVIGEELTRQQRTDTLIAARAFTGELRQKAAAVGIELPKLEESSTGDSIVMAGHQPVIYHPGLLYKVTKLHELADDTKSLAVSVAIDTDEGDGGRLVWPLRENGQITVKHSTIAKGGKLYRDQMIRSAEEVRVVFVEVMRDLVESGLTDVAARVDEVSKLYQSLEGEQVAVANSIVRAALTKRIVLEVPLSSLCGTPSWKARMLQIFKEPERFVSLYNKTLDAYRDEHGIKNPANPFPNMTVGEEKLELPFWSIEDGFRAPLFVKQRGEACVAAGALVVPRGSMVTFLLRSACADLFIHGLGGGKYDRFVDVFAQAYCGSGLPSFVVASETRHLFPHEAARYRFARELKDRYKELVSRTETFFGAGLFSAHDEALLRPMVSRRRELVEALKNISTHEDRRPIALALNDVNRDIKCCIDQSSLAPTLAAGGIDDVTLGRWEYREYPFFFFNS